MKYGVADIIHAATSDQDVQQIYTPMLAVVRQLIRACEKSGDIRPGANPDDFLIVLGFLWQIPPSPDEKRASRDFWRSLSVDWAQTIRPDGRTRSGRLPEQHASCRRSFL